MLNWFGPLAVLLAAVLLYIGLHYFNKRFPYWGGRTVALAATIVLIIAYLWAEPAIYDVRGLNMYSPFGDEMAKTVLAVLLVWFSYLAIFCAIFGAFFPYKTLHNINRFFSPVVLVLDLLFFRTYMTALMGHAIFDGGFDIRLPFFLALLAFTAATALSDWCADHTLPRGKEILTLCYTLPFAALAFMPAYVPQALFGYMNQTLEFEGFTPEHRLILYFSVIIPFLIFHAFKDKSEDVKRFAMIFLSVGSLFVFLGSWELTDFLDPTSWPLHLCHTAMFLVPLCLIFSMRRLYNFCLFINVIGAFLAMVLPDLSDLNVIETSSIIFWVNHYSAFYMPILLVALKIFKRPKFREWCAALIALIVYFFAMLICNPLFESITGESSDFFYLNDDFIVDNLGKWAERTQEYVVSVEIGKHTLTFMPIYQTLFLVIFVALTVGIWFLYTLLFSIWDAAEDRREREKSYKMMKKELTEFLGTKKIDEPITGDDSPRLTLRHFCKRYGSNKHYSVNDVSFEVKGGEIFGFLGPNGAGKSTIIKSIVGIQPLTSGDIEVCGFHVEKQAVQAKLRTGFVPDHYALYENLTGREYINYIADLYQVTREYRDAVIEKLVTRFQLVDSFDNQMKTYSHGMKQKITIMAALVHNPKVWILDEPLTGLDPTSIHEVKQCMKEHAAAGNIVFFSSHIIDVVEKICDRIAIIKKGKLRACCPVAELEAKGIELEQFYLSVIEAPDEEPAEAPAAEKEPIA